MVQRLVLCAITIEIRNGFGFAGMMADTVKNVLDNITERESKYKTIEVQKHIAVEIDEGNLLAVDSNEIDSKQHK